MAVPPEHGDSRPPPLAADQHAPFLRAPEASRSIFLVIFAAALAPLAAGVVFFGWRALAITALSVGGCMAVESAYYRVTRTPALLGRSHAAVTGLLLALTLPPFAPWYVPLVGAVFAIIVGKAIFGGVGHFLWQPALVGRLAVAVIFAPPIGSLNPELWPVLAQPQMILGDVTESRPEPTYRTWRGTSAPPAADAFELRRPRETLRELTVRAKMPPDSITDAIRHMPPAWDLICGAHAGGIGETSTIVILIAGLYLVYRNYVRAHLPGLMILAAAATVAVAPIRAGPEGAWQWLPITAQGLDVGFTYVCYHVACGELMLAAWFMATEMTSRPVTAPAQAIFGILCGVAAMLGRLYMEVTIPTYLAVLACSTLTPALDVIRPRPLGQRRFWQRRRRPTAQDPATNSSTEHGSGTAPGDAGQP